MIGYVRFGSKADICSAKGHVRFTPKSGHVRALADVRFVPIADIEPYSITSSADRSGVRHGEAERLGSLKIDHELEFVVG